MKLARSIIVFVLLSIAAGPVVAQAPAQGDVRTDLASALRVVRPLVRDDPARAIQILERLRGEYPNNARVLMLLGETYLVMGKTDAAKDAYKECFDTNPSNVQAGAALGMVYVQSGDQKSADDVFKSLLKRTEYGINSYRAIGATLSRNGYFDLALHYYREGMKRNDDNYILVLDIAYLLRSMGDYAGSLEEYLKLIETTPRQHRLAKNRIDEMLRDPNAPHDELIEVLRRSAEKNAPYRGVVRSILASAYLNQGYLELALEMALTADEEGEGDGGVLFNLANQAFEEYNSLEMPAKTRYFDLGLRALDAFLERYPSSPQVPRAKLMLIDLLVDVAAGRVRGYAALPLEGATDRAIKALDWLIASFPGTDYAEQAYLRKGDVVFHIQKNPEAALEIYRTGMKNSRFLRNRFAERLGRVYLVVERYDEAAAHFATLINSGNQELEETGLFYSGLLLCFEGQYEAARDTLTSLAEGNPSSQFTNDAIEMGWAIEEGLQGQQGDLKHYITALRAELRQDTTVVVSELHAVTDGSANAPLRPRCLFKLSEIYEGMGDHDNAVATLQTFIDDYPKHQLVPDAQHRIAKIYEVGYGKPQVALQRYEDILLLYPHYMFLNEVRDDVNRLREKKGMVQ